MALTQRIYSVLVVSAAERFDQFITPLLPEADFSPVHFARTNTAARQMLLERDYDLMIINAPLPDDFGTRLAIDASTNTARVVLLLVRTDIYDGVYAKIVQHGVLTVRKPVSPQIILQSLDYMRSTRERLRKMEKKATSVEDKIKEIRLVNRAKWVLISEEGMTEEQAHRAIEKMAMDECLSKREIAQRILDDHAENTEGI